MNFNKVAPAPPDKKYVNAIFVTAEIRDRKPDKDGNPYPKREECYINLSKTENSNKTLTKLILKEVIISLEGAVVLSDGIDH